MQLAIELLGRKDFDEPIIWGSGPAKLRGTLTGLKGVRDDIHTKDHSGCDFGFPWNSLIPPVAPGRVVFTSTPDDWWGATFGFSCIIDHGDGTRALYAHFAYLNVSVGDVVDYDTILGQQGDTGWSFGQHVHLGMSTDDNPFFTKDADGGTSRLLDPLDYASAVVTTVADVSSVEYPQTPDARAVAAHSAQYLSDSVERLAKMLEAGVPTFALATEWDAAAAGLANLRVAMDGLT